MVGATSSEVFLVVALLVDKGPLLYSTGFADVDIFSTFFKFQTEIKRHDAAIMPRCPDLCEYRGAAVSVRLRRLAANRLSGVRRHRVTKRRNQSRSTGIRALIRGYIMHANEIRIGLRRDDVGR